MVIAWLIALVCAVVCVAIPTIARKLSTLTLAIALAAGALIAIAGATYGIAPFPWTDVVVWVVASSVGLLLGRLIPPRFLPYLVFLIALSAADIIQIALPSGPPAAHSAPIPPAVFYVNFRIVASWLPAGRFNIGIFDLALLVTLGELWRRRGAPWGYALVTGLTGLTLAYAFLALTGIKPLPLIPFIAVGWLLVEAWYASIRARSVARGQPAD